MQLPDRLNAPRNVCPSRQSEMADPRSMCRTCHIVPHIRHNYIITHILTLWRTPSIAYFILSRIGEESLKKSLSPVPDLDPDDVRGGPSHGYNKSCVNI